MEQIIDGGVVVASVRLPETDDVVVLLDPVRRPDGVLPQNPFANVVRVSPSGDIGWRAELVPGETTANCWHAIRFDGGLRASTYSLDCVLDPDTGRIVESTFTK